MKLFIDYQFTMKCFFTMKTNGMTKKIVVSMITAEWSVSATDG